jgi:hypothetical protein
MDVTVGHMRVSQYAAFKVRGACTGVPSLSPHTHLALRGHSIRGRGPRDDEALRAALINHCSTKPCEAFGLKAKPPCPCTHPPQEPQIFFAPSFDLGDKQGGIHPRDKQVSQKSYMSWCRAMSASSAHESCAEVGAALMGLSSRG